MKFTFWTQQYPRRQAMLAPDAARLRFAEKIKPINCLYANHFQLAIVVS